MSDVDDAATFRLLFDRVMADAPAAPSLDEITHGCTLADVRYRRRPWAAGASVVLLAAATIALLIGLNRTRDTVRTVGDSGGSTAIASTPAAESATTAVTSNTATSAISTASTPGTIAALPVDPVSGTGPVLVTSGAYGVSVSFVGGKPVKVIVGPSLAARRARDGRVFALRPPASDGSDPGVIVMWDPETNTVKPLDVPNPTGGALSLHDVAIVDGRLTILYEHGPAVCDAAADQCDSALRTFEPDTGASTKLVTRNGARSAWITLSLADSGLVVGELSGADGTSFYSGLSGLGVAATNPQPADLGLSISLPGCSNCPRAYTIDSTGRYLAWTQGPDLVVIDLSDPAHRAVARSVVPDFGNGRVQVVIDIDRIVLDGESITAGIVAFASTDSSSIVDLATGTTYPVPGSFVTLAGSG